MASSVPNGSQAVPISSDVDSIILLLMKGATKSRKCGQRCQDHVFSMKPLRGDVNFRQEVTLQFCPKHSQYFRF